MAIIMIFWPLNAAYAMLIMIVAGGVGRLVGYWAKSSLRVGKAVTVFDMLKKHMKDLREQLENRINCQGLDRELK